MVGFGIDRVAAQADDPEVLRLENLDTDLPPPDAAVQAVRAALEDPAANSYLPFIGRASLRAAVAERLTATTGRPFDGDRNVVITAGGTEGVLAALLATVDVGDEVVLTDPTYAGLIQRVTLAGAVPITVPLSVADRRWRLDPERLAAAIGPKTRALLLMSPSMPTGHVLSEGEWRAVLDLCERHDLWLLYDAAMERLVFDGLPVLHPAALPGGADRVITIGSVSKEYRMIGWRIGWVAAPEAVADRVVWTHTYNVVTPPGLTQPGAEAALRAGEDDGVAAATAELQQRRDAVLSALGDRPAMVPEGGWSLLVDAAAMGTSPGELSAALLAHGKVAATPMTGWGDSVAPRHLRIVFSREPVERLATLGERFAAAGW